MDNNMRPLKERLEELAETVSLNIYKSTRSQLPENELEFLVMMNIEIGTNINLLQTLSKEQLIEIILHRELHLSCINGEIDDEMK